MKKITKRFFIVLLTLFTTAGTVFLTGCGGKGIEGTWILNEEIDANGDKLTQKDLEELGVCETYVIEGSMVKYKCEMTELSKPLEIEFELEELGNNKYNFTLSGGYVFASPEVKGNTMEYEVGEGDSYSKMIFKRQK